MASSLLVLAAGSSGWVALSPRPVCRTPVPHLVQPCMAFSLPSFSKGAPEPEGASEEAQGLFRMLGLAEDASYDEINAAYDALAVKYADNKKQLIKLEVAKDKILEDRLRQRMRGSMKGASGTPDDRSFVEKKPLISVPPFLEPYMLLPGRETLVKNMGIFGAIGLLPLLSLSWAPTAVSLGFAVALYLLYNRGLPDNSGEMEMAMRPPKVKPLVLSLGITLLFGAIGATLSQLVYGFLAFLPQQAVISLSVSLFFFVSATFFKVQDEY